MRFFILLILFAALALLLPGAEKESADHAVAREPAAVVKAGNVPAIQLREKPPITAEREAEIKRWIEMLADVDAPGYCYSSTLGGTIFSPQPESARTGALLLTDHALKASEAVRHLVEAGPDAMPFLLEKLDDAAATKYTIEHDGGFGGMWTAVEMGTNPADKTEGRPADREDIGDAPRLDHYTLKRGDLCLVILGQITGRGYQAVRYQPTACTIINSPVESKELRDAVRANWNAPEARTKLFERLLFDYATDGIFNGSSLDGWERGSLLRIEAARRLAYYFPDETSDLLVQRISALNLKRIPDTDEMKSWMHREVGNGARTEELLNALSGAKSPKVQQALLEAARRTDDPDLFLALLPAAVKRDKAVAVEKLRGFIQALPREEDGPYGAGYDLLSALVRTDGAQARQDIQGYLQMGSAQRRHSVCAVFERGGPAWAVEILTPLLDDRSAGEWGDDFLICDAAANALKSHHEGLSFDGHASRKDRDESIKVIKATLAAKKQRREND